MAIYSGDNDSNNLFGSTIDDDIYGLLGNDTLHGQEGNDAIYGDSSISQIQLLSPELDGSYQINDNNFLIVTLSQFNFSYSEPRSLGYAILDSNNHVLNKNIIIDNLDLANIGAAIDISQANATKLVFFTIPATQLNQFAWSPFDINTVDTSNLTSNVTIKVQEIDNDNSLHGHDSIYGHDSDDTLLGEGGNDNLLGAAGNDIISGGDGNDDIWGGNGNDILHGGHGHDRLFGENDDDKIIGGSGNDSLWGGLGNDTLIAGDGIDHIEGGNGNDVIYADNGDDEVWSGSGEDKVYGGNGNDYIDSGSGADLVFGGAGDDEIYGHDNNDDLRGGAGNDQLFGEDGNDILYGKQGNDELYGGSGNDELYGSVGSNRLQGGDGDDYLFAGWVSSDNYIDGQQGQDILIGSFHSDIFIFDEDDFQGQITTLSSGKQINKHIYNSSSGFDTLKMSGEVHADFTGDSYQTNIGVKGNVISGIESVLGDNDDQTLTINIHQIDAQSDDLTNSDWQGFIAWFGQGDDTLHLTGTEWSIDSISTPNASISNAMIEKLGLNATQVNALDAYVFEHIYSHQHVTIWTDAENMTYLGSDIL